MEPENGLNDKDINFKAPPTDEQEPLSETVNEADSEKDEERVERLVESEEMALLRSEAYITINALLKAEVAHITEEGQTTVMPRSSFVERYLNPYLELGQATVEKVAPEGQEQARFDLIVISARFEQDCGFEPEAIARLSQTDATLTDAGSKVLSGRWAESKTTWVGRPRLETEKLAEPLIESADMVRLRQQASDTIERLRPETGELQAGFALNRDGFVASFLDPYLELGQRLIKQSVPEEGWETASLELAVMAAQFQADCGFKSNGDNSLIILTNEVKHTKPEKLPIFRKNLDVLKARAEANWVKSTIQPEIQILQDQIERFLQGVSIETFDEGENTGQSINCQLNEEASLPDFRLLIQKAILPQLTDTGVVWVRGDDLPPEYLQALADEMLRTDFPVIAVYDKESGQYATIYDEGGEDEHGD
ncbi:MAG: hypothetical protein NUV80_04510 [Candidatus Berkelbacteria bacterium]|nr:hypothetical protein [Candidatus Berkelbacteria bacterium]MCR4307801.1 hypothetical protein [Candidatus Berkelbacteria bacterium]